MSKSAKLGFLTEANKLPFDYTQVSITELADGYCDALDTNNKNMQGPYLSALVVRLWSRVATICAKCKAVGWDYDESISQLIIGINTACELRAWKHNPSKVKNAESAISTVLSTRIISQAYYESNQKKHRANYGTISFDAPIATVDNRSLTLADTLETDAQDREQFESTLTVEAIVQKLIDSKKIVEAIFIDTIAFNDTEKTTKEVSKTKDENNEVKVQTDYYKKFWPYKVVQILSKLPVDYNRYFASKYNIQEEGLKVAVDSIRKSNNQKLYSKLRATLSKNSKMLLTALGQSGR